MRKLTEMMTPEVAPPNRNRQLPAMETRPPIFAECQPCSQRPRGGGVSSSVDGIVVLRKTRRFANLQTLDDLFLIRRQLRPHSCVMVEQPRQRILDAIDGQVVEALLGVNEALRLHVVD